MTFKYPVWAEINLRAISENIREIRRILKHETGIMGVVKANGYGHGAVKAAFTAVNSNVEYLGVSRFSEAVELREAGIQTPILVFGYTPPTYAEQLIHYDVTQTLYSVELAEQYSEIALRSNGRIKAHIKIDTGMGRLGLFIPNFDNNSDYKTYLDSAVTDVEKISKLRGLEVEGIYTHFASSDSPHRTYTENQLSKFNETLSALDHKKVKFRIIHSANSAAIINHPDSHFNMVRPGIAMYGIPPCNGDGLKKVNLTPAMQIKALVSHVKEIPAGSKISYNSIYTASYDRTRIATIPIGYADGYKWTRNPKGCVLVNGKRAPIVGRICMDFLMVDITCISDVNVGDEAVILGSQKEASLTAQEVAANAETISYEIISSLTARIPKLNL
jgi:alanine racemase